MPQHLPRCQCYDGNGQRVKKTAPNLTVLYFGEGYEKRGGVGIIHLFAGNQRIASVRSDGNTQFYHPDHLGSSWIVTDGNGAIKEKNEFYPFGTYLDSFTSYPFPPANYTPSPARKKTKKSASTTIMPDCMIRC